MFGDPVKVLAVDDPAVKAYVDPDLGVLAGWGGGGVIFDIVPWDRYMAVMEDALAGRVDYDVVMVAGHLWKRDLVERGRLLPLGGLDSDILPAVARECSYGNETYLSPSFCDGHMVVYRKDSGAGSLLGDNGAVAVTPADYLEAARSLGPGSTAVKADASEIFTDALPFLRMYGGDAYDVRGVPVCDSEAAIAGLETYLELRSFACGNAAESGNAEVAAALVGGSAALGITWSGQMGVVMAECGDREAFGFRTLTTAWNATWSFAVCAATPRPDAAKSLLVYLRSPDVDRVVGAASGAPVRESSYRAGMDEYPWYRCQLEMIGTWARQLPDIRNAGARNACLYEEIHKCFAGGQSAADGLARAKKRIERIS